MRVSGCKKRGIADASHPSRREACISSASEMLYIIKAEPCISSLARRVYILLLPRYSPVAKICTLAAYEQARRALRGKTELDFAQSAKTEFESQIAVQTKTHPFGCVFACCGRKRRGLRAGAAKSANLFPMSLVPFAGNLSLNIQRNVQC